MTGKLEFTILGSGSSGRRAARRRQLGRLRPGRTEEPAHPLLDAGAPARAGGDPATDTTVVVDTAPDFRLQAVRAGVKRVDACLFTHDHADQAHGIDDLRPFFLNSRKRVPTYMDAYTRKAWAALRLHLPEPGRLSGHLRRPPVPPHGQPWRSTAPAARSR
jgi:phosphoribosyl 1,2-cyclic phosphate phosphodiesterase